MPEMKIFSKNAKNAKKQKKKLNKRSWTLLSAGGNNGTRKELHITGDKLFLVREWAGCPVSAGAFTVGWVRYHVQHTVAHWETQEITIIPAVCLHHCYFHLTPFFGSWSSPSENLGGFHFSAGILREPSGYNGETMWCALIDLTQIKQIPNAPTHSWQLNSNTTEKTTKILFLHTTFPFCSWGSTFRKKTPCTHWFRKKRTW